MNEAFEKKVRAAAVAGWWVILIGYALLTLTWLVYLGVVTNRPAWLLAMWGGKMSPGSSCKPCRSGSWASSSYSSGFFFWQPSG